MLIYQFTKNKLMPSAPMDLETLNYYLHVQNDYVNKAGAIYNKKGQKICEIETYSFVEKPNPLMHNSGDYTQCQNCRTEITWEVFGKNSGLCFDCSDEMEKI